MAFPLHVCVQTEAEQTNTDYFVLRSGVYQIPKNMEMALDLGKGLRLETF